MSLRSDILGGVRRWLASLQKDARFSRSTAMLAMAEQARAVEFSDDYDDARGALHHFRQWLDRRMAEEPSTQETYAKIRSKTAFLLSTLTGMSSRKVLTEVAA